MHAMLLFAAKDSWFSLIPIVFFVIYALNRWLASAKSTPPPARRPPKRPAEVPGQRAAGQPNASQAQLNAEIEQFLRRAGERPRRGSSKGQPPAPPREVPESLDLVTPRDFDSVSKSVEEHIGGRKFTARAEHLADDIVRADEQMERHLQKSFNRRVGTLREAAEPAAAALPATDTAPEAIDVRPPMAADIAQALSNPKEIRRAIILNEILQRPEARW